MFLICIYIHILVVNEKSNLSKHQQLVSGVSIPAYWVGNYIADVLVAVPASILVFLQVYIFDVESFKNGSGVFLVTILFFIISCLPFTYLLHFLFKSPSKAQYLTILFYIVFGVVLSTTSYLLDFISEEAKDVNKYLKPFYRLLPTFLFGENLQNLSFKDFQFKDDSYWAYKLSSRNLLIMFIEAIVYFCLAVLIDYLGTFPYILNRLGLVVDVPKVDEELDDDVLNEQNRIKQGFNPATNEINTSIVKDSIVLCGLRKVYKSLNKDAKYNVAVKDIWYGVPQGQVFGFLGVNGAGKTSTLSMMTGERYPSSGQAYINGISIANQTIARRFIGYCPRK